jgi:hypothetical protein
MCSVAGVTMQLEEKVVKMVKVASELRAILVDDSKSVSPHLVMKTKGVLKAALDQVEGAGLMCLEMQQLENWLMARTEVKEEWVRTMEIPHQLRWAVARECDEWTEGSNPDDPVRVPWNGKLNFFEEPAAVIWSDACNYQKGWRVAKDLVRGFPEIKVQVPMSEAEMDDHITLQETSAGSDALMDVLKKRDLRMCSVGSVSGCVRWQEAEAMKESEASVRGGETQTGACTHGPHGRQIQPFGRRQSSAGGLDRVVVEPETVPNDGSRVGTFRAGRIRDGVEQ